MSVVVVLFTALCALSTVGGLLIVRRVIGSIQPGGAEQTGLVRVRAEVGTGVEQTLLALVRELQVPRGSDCAAYGDLYLASGDGDGLTVRTVSPLDRGLVAPLTMVRGTGCTEVTYAIVQLPQDVRLHAVALEFEARLVAALRRLDPTCGIRLAGTALRDLDHGVWSGAPVSARALRDRPLHRPTAGARVPAR